MIRRADAVRRGREAALDPHGLLGEPAQELGGVGDLGLGLGERLAHLERHQQRQLVGALVHRLERAAQDLAALARRMRRPLVLHGARGVERRRGVVGRRVGDLDERLAGRRVLDVERLAATASRHSPPMNSCVGAASTTARLVVGCDAHAATVSVPSSSEMDTSIE